MTLQSHHASNSPPSDGEVSPVTGWIVAVRGAISVETDTPEAIQAAMHAMMQELAERNGWFDQNSPCRVASLSISVTADLQSRSPASALRSTLSVWNEIPLFCAQEPQITGMMPRVIRVLVQAQWLTSACPTPVPIYLGEAVNLRPDLATK